MCENLEARARDLAGAAEDLRSHLVLRPDPPQYSALQQEMARFLGSLGSGQRILSLLQAVQVEELSSYRLPPLHLLKLLPNRKACIFQALRHFIFPFFAAGFQTLLVY